MPFTAYHFGPSGFVGLALRKWLDIPVFVLVNIAVDIEVLVINLLGLGRPYHRYFHTLLIGAVVGAVSAAAVYPARHLFKKVMQIIHIPYRTSLRKMVISGVLGAWLHVVIDAIYHWEVRLFWPSRARPLFRLLTGPEVLLWCKLSFIGVLILYVLAFVSYAKQNKAKKTEGSGL